MTVGFTASCFDLLHAGHILMLEEAKTVCDYLIVGLQTDPSIDRPTKRKPTQSIVERQIQIAAVKHVNQVIIYETEQDLLDILTALPIDIRIIGDDYRGKDFTGKHLNIPIHYNRRTHNWSTTDLLKRTQTRNTVQSETSPPLNTRL